MRVRGRGRGLRVGDGPGSLGRGEREASHHISPPPSTAGQLRALGFDLMNLANNHSLDYGNSGRRQTISALNRAGVAHTGLPGEITVRRVAGVRVAFLGFAPYSFDANLLDIPAAKALVRRARARARLVVVAMHAGAEGAGALHTPYGTEHYLGEDRGNPRLFAHAVINAGASIVLGSGPHVIRGIQRYRGKLIAYSLGNFVGYHTLGGGGVLSESAILRVTLGLDGKVAGARWISMHLKGGFPRPDPTHASTKLVRAGCWAEDRRPGPLPSAVSYSPRQTGSRFSRNAVMPSCASCASAFSVMTSSQCS